MLTAIFLIATTPASCASWGVDQPFMIDRGGVLMRKFGFAELPGSVVLDPRGNVRWTSTMDSTVGALGVPIDT